MYGRVSAIPIYPLINTFSRDVGMTVTKSKKLSACRDGCVQADTLSKTTQVFPPSPHSLSYGTLFVSKHSLYNDVRYQRVGRLSM